MKNKDAAAFPSKIPYPDMYGLTKREYFAAMALQGSIISGAGCNYDIIVEQAVFLADALLSELEKQNEKTE